MNIFTSVEQQDKQYNVFSNSYFLFETEQTAKPQYK